jgi:anti-sigma factor RsiW
MLENLEDYLGGTLEPAELRDFEAHLSTCGICREELRGIQDLSGLFGALQPDRETWEIMPGFASRVMDEVGRRKPAPALSGIFAMNMAFGRLVFASLLIMAVLGGYLVTHESHTPAGPSAEAILAQQNVPAFETGGAENNMLATLTAYEY